MLVINPRRVIFDGQTWSNVTSVAVSRQARGVIAEGSDTGQHVTLADVTGQRVSIEVVQELLGDDMDEPFLGVEGLLDFTTAGSTAGTPARRVRATCVIESVDYEVSVRRGSFRRVRLIAVSDDGVDDPLNVTNA